ncbi:TrmH family RNA methyltransferase [Echinicola rosea]|uniref:tRNA (guanosine(18)-2'-O)-methyltransferase n=1 Tax=Echinicola rosea TaxID=1807691 RepID=A0ABQ1UUI3_9BACT|nr:RNA methyltransferase [Echinicola rosea]GGF27141.1 tRNA (guanosine(18)-2'-O)-methyltransferase [Echinicola rosea]
MESSFLDKDLLAYLSQYITDHKKARMEEVLALRSRFFTVVLEDIYKPHNASAVIRTCDCFGVQDIHIIEKANSYDVNPYVTRGSAQWVDIHKYQDGPDRSSVDACFGELRSQGYKIMATSPHGESVPLHELEADQKTALVFGNEHAGVSDEVIRKSDGVVHIPMTGFTESFNISVSASICLYDLQQKIVRSKPEIYYLSEEEKAEIRFRWYKSVVKNVEAHIRSFYAAK